MSDSDVKQTSANLRGCAGTPGPGRPKGSQNKATAAARESFAALVEANLPKLQEALDAVYEKDKAKFVDLFLGLAEYVLPKLARTETTLSGDGERPPALIVMNSGRAK